MKGNSFLIHNTTIFVNPWCKCLLGINNICMCCTVILTSTPIQTHRSSLLQVHLCYMLTCVQVVVCVQTFITHTHVLCDEWSFCVRVLDFFLPVLVWLTRKETKNNGRNRKYFLLLFYFSLCLFLVFFFFLFLIFYFFLSI